MNCKFSIIIPVYKVEKVLERCLDSVITQSFTNWECILIDDGSPDKSGSICDEYAMKDNRFHVIHKENGGVSSARNIALSICQGEWVAFIDSDDYVEPHWLQSVIETMSSIEGDMYIWGIVNEDNEKHINWVSKPKRKIFEDSTVFIKSDYYRYNPVVYLYRKDWIEIYNCKFPEGIKLSEDQCFILEYLCHNPKVVTIPEIFYHYVDNPLSAVNTYRSSFEYADNVRVAALFSDYSLYFDEIDAFFVQRAIWRLFIDFFGLVSRQKDYDSSVQKEYNDCYDRIKKVWPSALNGTEFIISRCSLRLGLKYWNHKNGIIARLGLKKQ